jgi:hypothetical protein
MRLLGTCLPLSLATRVTNSQMEGFEISSAIIRPVSIRQLFPNHHMSVITATGDTGDRNATRVTLALRSPSPLKLKWTAS